MTTYPSGWTDPEEIAHAVIAENAAAFALDAANHARRERWSEAVRGGRLLREFSTDPKYARHSTGEILAYARDYARAVGSPRSCTHAVDTDCPHYS